jgi:23S rRNA (cytidine2498-2'-O)-methyltransferase
MLVTHSMTQLKEAKSTIFYYFLCNEGSEKFLKEEIKLIYHELAFAYSKPGFLTFKELRPLGKTLRPVFCRHFGRFIKRGKREEVISGLEHFLEYDLEGNIVRNIEYKLGDHVLEVIKVSENEYYLGEFESSFLNSPTPGGFSLNQLPEESPSRAYLKVVDAKDYLGIQFQKGERALEIGSSPGGATYALLEQGLSVEGIDPGEMHERCLVHPKFIHHQKSIQDFKVYELKGHIDWLFVDMNLAPEGSLREIEKVVEAIKPSLKGAFLTLKMTKFELVKRVPMYLTIVEKMGLNVVMATQLPSHKQEFLIFAKPKNN